jgi:hypothetical protein
MFQIKVLARTTAETPLGCEGSVRSVTQPLVLRYTEHAFRLKRETHAKH